jgi:hypothetical protein
VSAAPKIATPFAPDLQRSDGATVAGAICSCLGIVVTGRDC